MSEPPANLSAYRALFELTKLRLRGQLRKLLRTVKTPKGALMTVMLLGLLVMALAPRIALPRLSADQIRDAVPRMARPSTLFLLWIGSLLGTRWAIAFSMAEVDFLFPGPFGRRQLLIYKLATSALGPLNLAILSPLFVPFTWWPATLVGVFLVALFMQWFAIALDLVMRWWGARYQLVPYLAIAAMLGAAFGSIWQDGVFDPGVPVRERLGRLEMSSATRVAQAPFVAFSNTINATSGAELATWAMASLATVLAVGTCIITLDAFFIEASLDASRRRYEALERLKSSGGMSAFRLRERPRATLPNFPRLAGAGAIAWRQTLETLRRSGGMLLTLAVPVGIGAVAGLVALSSRESNMPVVAGAIGITCFVAVLVTTGTSLGLRADLDYVDVLKSLPLGSGAIVSGSVAAGVMYVLGLQLIANVVMAIVMGYGLRVVGLALLAALPLNLLLVGCDSILVLMFPSIREFTPGDLFAGLRMIFVNLVKMTLALVAVGTAGVAILLVQLFVTDSLPVLVGVAATVLILEGLALIGVVKLLFDNFDPSAHAAESES